MILGTSQILSRLEDGQIFRKDTWVKDSVKEASYALRVAGDGMIIGKHIIKPGAENARSEIEIEPGRIAVLSTKERLCMPSDLVGRLGVRLEFASKGLVGLMGMQVDPYYGSGEDDEVRLYIKVANLGNKNVYVRPDDRVFNIEFSTVEGTEPQGDKEDTWTRLIRTVDDPSQQDWTYLTQIVDDLDTKSEEISKTMDENTRNVNKAVEKSTQDLKNDLSMRLGWIRDNQQAVVMFGVFLVAITILTVMVGVILNVRDAPSWVMDTGWILLLGLCIIAVVAVVAIAVFLFFFGLAALRTANKE